MLTEMDPWLHIDRRKVLSRKPLSEGPWSASQALCMCRESGRAVCPQSSTFPVINPGRLIPCWRGDGISQVTCVMEESQLGKLGELAALQAPGTVQGRFQGQKQMPE